MKRPTNDTVLIASGLILGAAILGTVFSGSSEDAAAAARGLALDAALFGTASAAWHGVRAGIDRHEEQVRASRHRRPRPAAAVSGTMAVRPPIIDLDAIRGAARADTPQPPAPAPAVEARTIPVTGPAGPAAAEPTPQQLQRLAQEFNNYLTGPAARTAGIARLDDTDDGWAALSTPADAKGDLYWHPPVTA